MSKSARANTITTRVESQIATPLSLRVAYDNERFESAADESYLRVSIREGGTGAIFSRGTTRLHRFMGVLFVQVFVPAGMGTNVATTITDQVESAFRYVTEGTVRFEDPSTENVGRSGDHWQFNVTCPFYEHEVL